MSDEFCANENFERCRTIVGNILTTSWEISEQILQHLSFRELIISQKVCRIWADVAHKILKTQRQLYYLTLHSYAVKTLEGEVSCGTQLENLHSVLDKFFDAMTIQADVCIGFCSENWLHKSGFLRDRNGKDISLLAYLGKVLPPHCQLYLLCARGIVGTNFCHENNTKSVSLKSEKTPSGLSAEESNLENGKEDSQNLISVADPVGCMDKHADAKTKSNVQCANAKSREIGVSVEIEYDSRNPLFNAYDAFSFLFIPKHPGVNIKFFSLSRRTLYKEYDGNLKLEKLSSQEFAKVTGIPEEEDIKALLFFDASYDDDALEAFISSSISRQNEPFAVGGGMVESLHPQCSDPALQAVSLGIAFSGTNILAASVVIPQSVHSSSGVHKYMQDLKNCCLPEEHSFAFMFACCGRGQSWYKRSSAMKGNAYCVESGVFRKFFPKTPIFGFFGAGEIGRVHLPKFGTASEVTEGSSPKRRKKKVLHQYTTIIVLISIL